MTIDVNAINNIEASKDKLTGLLDSVNTINLNEDFLKMNSKQFLMANLKTLIDYMFDGLDKLELEID